MVDREQNIEAKTVADLLDEIENETLYRTLLTVDRRTLQIVLLKMQGYPIKEFASQNKRTNEKRLQRISLFGKFVNCIHHIVIV